MPLIGYALTGLIAGAFLDVFEAASSWVSFILLALIGGKMIFDCIKEMRAKARRGRGRAPRSEFSVGKLALQAVATSIDALAIGVTLQMASISPRVVSARRMVGAHHRRGDLFVQYSGRVYRETHRG